MVTIQRNLKTKRLSPRRARSTRRKVLAVLINEKNAYMNVLCFKNSYFVLFVSFVVKKLLIKDNRGALKLNSLSSYNKCNYSAKFRKRTQVIDF